MFSREVLPTIGAVIYIKEKEDEGKKSRQVSAVERAQNRKRGQDTDTRSADGGEKMKEGGCTERQGV